MRTALSSIWIALAVLGCSGPQKDSAGVDSPALGPVDTVYQFDHEFDDVQPRGWRVSTTGDAEPAATWAVRPDPTAPSPGKVLSLTRQNHSEQSAYNVFWTNGVRFLDGRIECVVRADSGKVDQGGGVAWRIQGENDYYVCRFNPLESNIRVYFVKNGKRVQLATEEVETSAGAWYKLRVDQTGNKIVCSLDGKKLLEVEDGTFPEAGGVGLWTKADARTSFDNLTITKP